MTMMTMNSTQRTQVLLVDDHAVLRAGLRLLINAESDMEVIAEAGDVEGTRAMLRKHEVDVVVMDLGLPGEGGLASLRRFRNAYPDVGFLVLTMHDEPSFVRSALAEGASAYLVKTAADGEMIQAIRAVARGEVYLDAVIAHHLEHPHRSGSLSTLSDREQQVLRQLAAGHTARSIAEDLQLSPKTVETYRARISEKLGLRTRADFVRYGVETGLLAADNS